MKRMTRFALLVGFLAACSSAQADMIARKTVTYFSIGGKTAADLDREMSERGPLLATGRRHPGATRVTFSGKASYIAEGGRCRIGEARIMLTTKMMLPRWKNRSKADARMALLWDTLSADIKRHEERHAEIARNHARTLERTLRSLRAEKSCDALKAKVAVATAEALEAHDADQKRFDRIEAVNFGARMTRLLRYRATGRAE
jgi:predicted secreted Zn-dependent protease